MYVRVVRDAEPAFIAAVSDGVDDGESWFTAEVPVHNPVTNYRVLLRPGGAGYSWLNGSGEYFRDVADQHDFRLTTFDPGPDWALDSVVYQVFPDRFASIGRPSELPDVGACRRGGTTTSSTSDRTPRASSSAAIWTGSAQHLDHLVDLGANVLYLTPIFPARSNHRYNASTFAHVDPLLGGDEALARLSGQVHARGHADRR